MTHCYYRLYLYTILPKRYLEYKMCTWFSSRMLSLPMALADPAAKYPPHTPKTLSYNLSVTNPQMNPY